MNTKVFIRLKDKETGKESQEVPIEDLIYNQYEIEFEFGNYEEDDYGTLPYKDFLFFQDDYEVIVKIKGEDKKIEKIDLYRECPKETRISKQEYLLESKINEIIDKLNEGDKQ